MAKLTIYYNYYNRKAPRALKVRIDKNELMEIRMHKFATIELESGKHFVEMYRRGMSNYDPVGYIEDLVEISEEENYYIYKPNALNIYKCKFYRVTKKEMEKIIKKKETEAIIWMLVIIILVVLGLLTKTIK